MLRRSLPIISQGVFSRPSTRIIHPAQGVQLHKCVMTYDTGEEQSCYVLMKKLRKDDTYIQTFDRQKMIDLFFPKTTSEMAESLSNVTSAFYGIMLENTGQYIGMDHVDFMSRGFFYKLGRTKARLTKEGIADRFTIPEDARGVVILLVSAIYNASPEYKFHVRAFSEDRCEIDLTGVDRYYRITRAMGMHKRLEWPVLHRFVEGLNDELKANSQVKSEMISINENAECHERFIITRR